MSIHGGVGRSMTLLSFEWKKNIDEYDGTLDETWHLTITIAWYDLTIERIPNRKHFSMKYGVCGFGYWINMNRNYETIQKSTFGDASERLLQKKVK